MTAAPDPDEGGSNPTTPATDGEGDAIARVGTAVAWVIGVALMVSGILGMAAGGSGIVLLVLGLFVTPRTRRELKELCRLLCGE